MIGSGQSTFFAEQTVDRVERQTPLQNAPEHCVFQDAEWKCWTDDLVNAAEIRWMRDKQDRLT